MQTSILTLPLQLNRQQLEAKINEQLGTVLYDAFDEQRGVHVKAELLAPLGMIVETEYLAYRVPIRITLEKREGFFQGGATGAVQMDLRTDYQIATDWTMQTTTALERYEWLEAPKLNLGGIKLGVQWIADQVLPRVKDRLGKTIDAQIAANAQIREQVEKAWTQMNQPQPAPGEVDAFTEINPLSLGMTPLVNDGENVRGTVLIEAQPKVFVGTTPVDSPDKPLPDLKIVAEPGANDTDLYLRVDVMLATATEMGREQMRGTTIEIPGKDVVVQDLTLTAEGHRLRVDTELRGGYNGRLSFLTRPGASADGNIQLSEFEVEMDTRNVLFRAAGHLFRGTIQRKMHENIEQQLRVQMDTMRSTVREQLRDREVADGVRLRGDLREIRILSADIVEESLRLTVRVLGEVAILV